MQRLIATLGLALEGFQPGSRGDTSAFFPYMRVNLQVRRSVFTSDLKSLQVTRMLLQRLSPQ